MKIHISINGQTFEVASSNSIEIKINRNQDFDYNTNEDKNVYPPKKNITIVYTITFPNPKIYYDKKIKCWCRRDRFIERKATNKDEIKGIIQERIKKVGNIDNVGIFYIKVQHFNENNEVIYEKDLGDYKITHYKDIVSKEYLCYTIAELHSPVYRDGLNEVKWNINELKDEFYLVTGKYDGLQVEAFPQDVNLISQDLDGLVYQAKQR